MRILVLIAPLILAACGGAGLRDLSTDSAGPDEFSVLPARPLQMPPTLTLPPPGGANLAEVNPRAEAVALLGGRPGAGVAGDAALLAAVGPAAADIRATLAAEDAAFRGLRGRLGNPFARTDRYFRAYAGQSLDARAETARWAAAGARVPTVPPAR
ncbi:MAG: DUF3035 domain-containing protein [Paracoccaceae bacterium]